MTTDDLCGQILALVSNDPSLQVSMGHDPSVFNVHVEAIAQEPGQIDPDPTDFSITVAAA